MSIATEFLQKLRPGGPWVLTAIIPDGATVTITATNADEVDAFVRENDGKKNLYYSVNQTRTAMTSKAKKTDIVSIEYLLADLDPNEGESPEAAKARYLTTLITQPPPSTTNIDSGNGIQVLWRLAEPIKLAEPILVNGKKVFPPETAALIADVEARQAAMMQRLGSVAGTQNIDRILRLPGTTNLPNAKKIKAGRTACPTKLILFNGATCTLEDFSVAVEAEAASTDNRKDDLQIDWVEVASLAGWLTTVADLPTDFSIKGRMIVAHGGNLKDLNNDLEQAGVIEKLYGSWSDVSFALAAIFKADGRYTREQIAAALLCDLDCNKHVTKHKDEVQRRRAVERLLTRSHEPTASRVARALNWRECKPNGSPLPSMHNARLAITALGIECSFDTFHNKMLFGYNDDTARHVLQPILGEVSDNGIISLRQLLSDRFGFDLTDKHLRDAVISLALEHCFDPVLNMLAEAEGNWDGVPRLDRMAVDYFNCEDTPLNSACVRKTMIAAVARVRNPGCKFDTILVLESLEGWNKSSAWLVLARGAENFSDESIIGKDSREVQEQLATVWIHENGELAGMTKAEVETVKAFASRTIDRARPAYGHFLKKQRRHSIEVGTTNGDEYLQSQTGNRRFWPMRVLKVIDLEKLERDSMQLWAEAAHYQSKGESLTLDESMWAEAGVQQEARRVKDPWEPVLADIPEVVELKEWNDDAKKWFVTEQDIVHHIDDQYRVATADLLKYVLKLPIERQEVRHGMRLATVMKVLGLWQRTDNGLVTIGGKQVKGYFRWAGERAHKVWHRPWPCN